jgi:hypothetical protein
LLFLSDKSKNSDLKALEDIKAMADKIASTDSSEFDNVSAMFEEIKRISKGMGVKTQVQDKVYRYGS